MTDLKLLTKRADILFYYLFILFIILPHSMNYKQNKNDNR